MMVEEPGIGRVDLGGGVVDPHAELPRGRPEDVGERRRCGVAHATVPEFADRDLAAFELIGLLGWPLVGGEQLVFALELAVGRVGEHVRADGEGRVDLALDRRRERPAGRPADLPQAGEARHRRGITLQIRRWSIDQACTAAIVDAQQRPVELRRHERLGVPGGVLGRQQVQAVFRLGKDLPHQLAKAAVEVATRRAASFGEDEAALIDVAPQPRPGVGPEIERTLAREPEHGRLAEVVERRRR